MNKKQLIIELAMPIVFALVSIYIIVKAIPMEGEGVFPIMSAGVLLICAAYLFFETLVKKEVVVTLEGVNLGKVAITLLALIVYVLLIKKIGYIIDTFLLCVFIIRSLGYKKIGVTVLCAALAVCATFVVFKVLLSVPLPMIFLDF
ncbi:MAG: tripartite tricarboxylate transporter TctB family protein [Clostridium sp.]|nr:tripartite tricarboxylate transporter TctB family protein [Clostridium sp.]